MSSERLPTDWSDFRAASVRVAVLILTALVLSPPVHAQNPNAAPSSAIPLAQPRQFDARSAADVEPGVRRGLTGPDSAHSGPANYGRPRPRVRLPRPLPRQRVYAPAPFSPSNPLLPLEPYRTSAQARRVTRGVHLRPGLTALPPPPTVAVAPTIKAKPRPRPEDRPYDPVGIGVGSLRLTPLLDANYGYDSNPNRIAGTHHGSQLFRADGALAAQSEWGLHAFRANMRLGYSEYFDLPEASRPDGAGTFAGRYDVIRGTALIAEGRFNLDTQRPGAPAISSGVANVTVTNRPIVFSVGTSVGATQKFGRLDLSLRGSFDRTMYENAHYSDGTTLDLASTDFNAYGGTLRAGFEITPDLTPFVEATLDKRVHDTKLDVYGYARDSNGVAARGGARLQISDLLRGQVAGGYAERRYEDTRLPELKGPTLDAELIYTPSPLTTLTLRTTTSLNETTAAAAAGVLSHAYTALLSHDLLRNLTISAQGTYLTNDYQGADIKEKAYSAGVRLEYKITRSIAIRGSYIHEHLHNTSSGSDYTANVFLVGLRLQR